MPWWKYLHHRNGQMLQGAQSWVLDIHQHTAVPLHSQVHSSRGSQGSCFVLKRAKGLDPGLEMTSEVMASDGPRREGGEKGRGTA